MKNLIASCLSLLLGASTSFAANEVGIDTLTGFADKYSYKDNRKNLKRDKQYSSYKNSGDDKKPHSVIEAYPRAGGFGQIALWCDHCGDIKGVTSEQTKLCQTEFGQLYNELTGEAAPETLVAEVASSPKRKVLKSPSSRFRLRVSPDGLLHCDGQSGYRLRVDFFAQ